VGRRFTGNQRNRILRVVESMVYADEQRRADFVSLLDSGDGERVLAAGSATRDDAF
jgi:hypothetical protein